MSASRASRAARAARLRSRIRRPPAHWALLGFCLAGLAVMLAVQGVAAHTTGASGTAAGGSGASPLAGRPALLALGRGETLAGREQRVGNRIALTFDDGPDPKWTPRIEAVLRREHVPATFFVVGSHVVQYPDLVRGLFDHGFELGNHTFSHLDLAAVPGWERGLQLDLTEKAVAGAVGVRPRLMRPPYSATPDAVTTRQLPALVDVARRGYAIALSDLDARDWSRPGVAEIVRNASPPGRTGGIVLMHDGGGDRSQTVSALERLIPLLSRARLPVRAGVGSPGPSARGRRSHGERRRPRRGRLLLATMTVARWITEAFTFLLWPIALLAVLRMIVLVAVSRRHARKVRARAVRRGVRRRRCRCSCPRSTSASASSVRCARWRTAPIPSSR